MCRVKYRKYGTEYRPVIARVVFRDINFSVFVPFEIYNIATPSDFIKIGDKFLCSDTWMKRMHIIHNLLITKYKKDKYEEPLNLYAHIDKNEDNNLKLKTNKPLDDKELYEGLYYYFILSQDKKIIDEFIDIYCFNDDTEEKRKIIFRTNIKLGQQEKDINFKNLELSIKQIN